jgi:hypothetical protein
VIDHPRLWKDELVKVADRLEAKTRQTRWAERTGFLLERDFVLGAYALRKLVESRGAAEEFGHYRFPVLRFDRLEKTAENPDEDVDEVYDLENGSRKTLSVLDLCYEILHCTVLAFCCGETADLYDGIFVASDRSQDDCVYLVLASDFIALCGDIGSEAD